MRPILGPICTIQKSGRVLGQVPKYPRGCPKLQISRREEHSLVAARNFQIANKMQIAVFLNCNLYSPTAKLRPIGSSIYI